jgi:hypothetical protein
MAVTIKSQEDSDDLANRFEVTVKSQEDSDDLANHFVEDVTNTVSPCSGKKGRYGNKELGQLPNTGIAPGHSSRSKGFGPEIGQILHEEWSSLITK